MNPLLDPKARLVIGHRGNSAHFPENTIPAFDSALSLGADAIEFDIRVSADGVPVVIHDAAVDRTTNGTGLVSSFTVQQLKTLDAGARFTRDGGRTFPFRGTGVVVPTFEEVVQRFADVPLLIEVKVPEAAEPIRAVLARHGAEKRAVVASEDMRAVLPFRGGAQSTGASKTEIQRLLGRACVGLNARTLPYKAVCAPWRVNGVRIPIGLLARAARRGGAVTHVWTVDDPAVARALWGAGANGIITNDVARLGRAGGARLTADR